MCGRFSLTSDPNKLQLAFPWVAIPQHIQPRYNIAPSQPIAVISNQNRNSIDYFSWGLIPFWAKDPKIGNRMINARSETLAEKPSFKHALKYRRCLILSDGYYEWKKVGSYKIPIFITMRDKTPFAFAGLWEHWTSNDGSEIFSATIITTSPNDKLSGIHNRMPVIIASQDYLPWLDLNPKDEETRNRLFSPYSSEKLDFHPVSPIVNNPRNDSPNCIIKVD